MKKFLRVWLALAIGVTLVTGSVSTASAAKVVTGPTSTPWMSPSAYDEAGVQFVTNATNAYATRDRAVATFAPTSDIGGDAHVAFSGFGFKIPSNATITGVQVEYKAYGADGGDLSFYLIGVGATSEASGAVPLGTSIPTSYTYAPPETDYDWDSYELNPAAINSSSFGISVVVELAPEGVYLDHIALKVYYIVPATSVSGTFIPNPYPDYSTNATGTYKISASTDNVVNVSVSIRGLTPNTEYDLDLCGGYPNWAEKGPMQTDSRGNLRQSWTFNGNTYDSTNELQLRLLNNGYLSTDEYLLKSDWVILIFNWWRTPDFRLHWNSGEL